MGILANNEKEYNAVLLIRRSFQNDTSTTTTLH